MKNFGFKQLLALLIIGGTLECESAFANAPKTYPANVSCQLSLDAYPPSDSVPVEDVARSCNDFRVQNELEFNFVKGACVLGASLSGLLYSFNEGQCKSAAAAALCRVQIQGTGMEEATWYFEPKTSRGDQTSHEEKFKASCDELGGDFVKLKFAPAEKDIAKSN